MNAARAGKSNQQISDSCCPNEAAASHSCCACETFYTQMRFFHHNYKVLIFIRQVW